MAQETSQADVGAAIKTTVDAFVESRAREGSALQTMLLSRVDDIEAIVQRITPLVPQVIAQFQQKATERMQEAHGIAVKNGEAGKNSNAALQREEEPDRSRQWIKLYGIRVDVEH